MKSLTLKKVMLMLFCATILLVSCTKYTGTNSSTTTGSGSTSGPDPLPPYGGGSSSGSGSSGSGSSSGSGGGTVNPNIPKAYVQGFIFTGEYYVYTTVNDSVSLKQDGSYTELYSGNTSFKYKSGSGASTDPVLAYGNYFTRPYSFYTYINFKTPQYSAAETMLYNDLTTPPSTVAQIRYISLDPLTASVPVKFKLSNYLETTWTDGRKYLDHRDDTTFCRFTNINPGASTVSFYYRDSLMLTFTKTFDAGKKYTVFAGASAYVSNNRGQFPVSVYYVTQHN